MKVVTLRITTPDDGRADIRDFEDLHNFVRNAASQGFGGRIEQLGLVDSLDTRNLRDVGPLYTVGPLVRELLKLPDAMALSSAGSDSGGYDCVEGNTVWLYSMGVHGERAHIEYDGSND